MKFILIDYSEIYYRRIANKTIPKQRGGKFVQLLHGESEYLALSPADLSSHHANIVERFCVERQIQSGYTSKRMDEFTIYDANWEVGGGGRWTIDERKRKLHLFGDSYSYGKFDSKHLQENILAINSMSGYEIKIDGKK